MAATGDRKRNASEGIGEIRPGARKHPAGSPACLLLSDGDNTVTALRALPPGETVAVSCADGSTEVVRIRETVPFAHKFARTPIPKGGSVLKYGEVIGRATADIAGGSHVHVHNVEGLRAGSGPGTGSGPGAGGGRDR